MARDAVFANAFNQMLELGPVRLRRLREHFETFESAWKASRAEIARAGLEPKVADAVAEKRNAIDPDRIWEELERAGIQVLLENDTGYPARLKRIPSPPQILYIKGTLPPDDKPAVAVVGTRRPSRYGLEACEVLTRDLATSEVVIVSGLALGIDTRAHAVSLEAGGTTVAVLGSGHSPRVLYPAANRGLAEKIVGAGGAVISEYPYDLKAQLWTFPQRNRIIAALAEGTLVVEAKERSGARITARYALDFGKDVFAVPGEIFSQNAATPHELIRDGAMLATSAKDILFALGLETPEEEAEKKEAHTDEEKHILSFLIEPKHASDLTRESALPTPVVNQTLTILEIRGIIKHIGWGLYRKL